jgi:BON domain
MAIATLSEVDTRIRDLVMRELEWDAAVDASAIGVAAKDRTVTLTGYVDTYLGKLAAERAAKRVRGVRAVANDIEVRPKVGRTDADIARDVVRSLELRSTVPDNVQATVHHSYLTLTGKPCGNSSDAMRRRQFDTSVACVASSIGSAWRRCRPRVTFAIALSRHCIAMPISMHVT